MIPNTLHKNSLPELNSRNPVLKSVKTKEFLHNITQCPRTDLNKRFLPRPETKDYYSLYPVGLKSARIEIPHIGSHYIDFSKTDFY